LIGLFQSLALIPGMSRSGMTIAGGLFSNLGREQATRFSFLLATPVLLGSGIKKFLDLQSDGILNSVGIELLWGTVAAFIVGLLAIHFLIKYLKNHTLKVFVWYRVVLAILILLIL
jgi:undecaprenyl-diphosphatase